MAGIVLYLNDIKRACAWQHHVLICLCLCETLQHDRNQRNEMDINRIHIEGKNPGFLGKDTWKPAFFRVNALMTMMMINQMAAILLLLSLLGLEMESLVDLLLRRARFIMSIEFSSSSLITSGYALRTSKRVNWKLFPLFGLLTTSSRAVEYRVKPHVKYTQTRETGPPCLSSFPKIGQTTNLSIYFGQKRHNSHAIIYCWM